MIYITFKGIEYVIPYDRETLKLNRAIDSTFDNGYFESEPLEASSGLDFSRRVPRGLLVRIVYDEREFIFKTGETYIQQIKFGDVKKYVHMINLVSLSRDLTMKPMENITVTQPKGDFGLYTRSLNVGQESIASTTDPFIINFQNTVSTNPSKIDGLEIKQLDDYTLDITAVFKYLPAVVDVTLLMDITYNDVSIRTEIIFVPAAIGFREREIIRTVNLKQSPSVLGEYGVTITRTSSLGAVLDANLTFGITSTEVIEKPVRTYAQVIDKMLAKSEYVLSPQSRARLNLTAPEDKYEEYTLFDALTKLSGYVGALPRVGGLISEITWRQRGVAIDFIELDFLPSPYEYTLGTVVKVGTRYYYNDQTGRQRREILFEYFDNPSVFIPINVQAYAEQAELDDYVSAIELNTKNVLKPLRYSPFRGGWKSLRSLEGVGQFTTDNIGYETEDNIERMIKVVVKGVTSRNASETITYTVDDETDITERVLEKAQWDTLPSEADYSYSGKLTLLKNNTLYYIKGDNKIYGMSYIGEQEGRLIGQPDTCRSLYETVYAVRSGIEEELISHNGSSTGTIDPARDGDLLVQMQVEYSNQTQSRARVYKDDQSGFDTELIKYFNESSNVNESEAIGNYAQLIVNRLGGTKISYEGVVDSLDEIANLGDVDDKNRVYTIIELWLGRRIKYKYTLVQDYNIISSYIGIQSRHRVEEISSDSTTIRTLRYTSKLIFTDSPQSFTTRLINHEDLLEALIDETSDGITYGYLECNLSDGQTKKLHLSVDSDNKGKTIELKWALQNNFSGGMKRYPIVRGEDTIWLNLDVGYTDYYGKVNDILFALYYSANVTDLNEYPEALESAGSDQFTVITDTIDKDAGEILHGLVEIPILSESDKIRVYNGFARWNKVVEGTDRIRACALEYVPIKNANKIDITRIRDLTVNGTLLSGELNLTFTLDDIAKGIAFYHVDTLDLVLAYIDDLDSGAHDIDIFYTVKDNLYTADTNYYISGTTFSLATELAVGGYIYEIFSSGLEFTMTTDLDVDGWKNENKVDGISFDMSADLGIDGWKNENQLGDIEFMVTTDLVASGLIQVSDGIALSVGTQLIASGYKIENGQVTFSMGSSLVASGWKDIVEVGWVSGGTSPVGANQCNTEDDVGNVRCTLSCSWTLQSTYFSSTDDTSLTTCIQDAERIVCLDLGGTYSCRIETANESWTNCETCEVL